MAKRDSDFAVALRMLRAKADISQEELARRAGVSTASVVNWEDGKYMPSLATAVKLADIFGVTINQLAGLA